MSEAAVNLDNDLLPVEELLQATQEIVDQDLKPLTVKIDF